MFKANLYRQNHAKKHTHKHAHKERKEKDIYIYILKRKRNRAPKSINKSTNDNELEILN